MFGGDFLGSVSQRRRFANAARLQKLYSLAQKADTESHQPSLPVIGGVVATAPALRKHNQDQSSKETVKTISLELDRVERGV